MGARLSTPRRSQGFAERWFPRLLLVYVAADAGFHRDLARLHISLGVVPLFTGEAAILLLGALQLAVLRRRGRTRVRLELAEWLLVAYMTVGLAFAVRGLALGYGLAALRDFALVYYSVFFFFARSYFAAGKSALGPIWALSIGGTVAATWRAVAFLWSPSLLDGHGAPAHVGLLSWIAAVGLLHLQPAIGRRTLRMACWAGVVVDMFAVYLTAYRTLLGVALASLVLLAVGQAKWPGRAVRGVVWRLAVVVLSSALLVGLHRSVMPGLSPALTVDGPVTLSDGLGAISLRWSGRNLRSELLASAEPPEVQSGDPGTRPPVPKLSGELAPSYVFRARAWRNALSRIARSPVVGIGFGPPAALFPDRFCELPMGPLSNCGNAHNTFLTLAMRMGIPSLVLFLAVNAVVVRQSLRGLRRTDDDRGCRPLAGVACVAYVSCLVYASMSLFFESPYLSVVFWVVLACLTAVPGGCGEEAKPRSS